MKPALEKRKMRVKPNLKKFLKFGIKKIQTYGKHHPQGDGTEGNNEYFLMIQKKLETLRFIESTESFEI